MVVEERTSARTQRLTPWARRMLRRHYPLLIGGVLLSLTVISAVGAPFLGTRDPQALSVMQRLRPPTRQAWFGTDVLGRDVYSRTIYGSRVSLTVGVGVASLSLAFGLVIGLVAGYNRRLDGFVMRIMDGLMSIPAVLLAISLMALSRPSLRNVIVAITIVEIPRVTRLVRGVVLTLRDQPFVEAAVTSGAGAGRILWRHLLPNTIPPLLVQGSYACASAMMIEAVLSFIGAGSPPSIPSWGNIMAEGRATFQIAPHIVLCPGLFLSLTVLAVNLIGDDLRDTLDPRLAKRV